MKVTVVWATQLLQDIVAVEVSPGSTIAEAVRRSGLVAQYGLDPATLRFARYGVRAAADACVAKSDRVEITRALLVDPKAARVRRARLKAPAPRAAQAGPGTAR